MAVLAAFRSIRDEARPSSVTEMASFSKQQSKVVRIHDKCTSIFCPKPESCCGMRTSKRATVHAGLSSYSVVQAGLVSSVWMDLTPSTDGCLQWS
jgi:hypothetical protein